MGYFLEHWKVLSCRLAVGDKDYKVEFIKEVLTSIIRSHMMTLHIIEGAATCRTCVHIDIEGFMVQAALIYRLTVVHCHLQIRW